MHSENLPPSIYTLSVPLLPISQELSGSQLRIMANGTLNTCFRVDQAKSRVHMLVLRLHGLKRPRSPIFNSVSLSIRTCLEARSELLFAKRFYRERPRSILSSVLKALD